MQLEIRMKTAGEMVRRGKALNPPKKLTTLFLVFVLGVTDSNNTRFEVHGYIIYTATRYTVSPLPHGYMVKPLVALSKKFTTFFLGGEL